ncbi:hypothetical protein CF050_15875 [Clostridium botulinum]|uniref:helix-turn-helix domain-containing protein n=1 Tax=Clostridium botulinum TaxID=1491 RepID=UPI001969D402|nr:helix-turn-helix domain-containing protein [Clostridium botulinum]MBN3348314.1 hypothetical protein [Clostridium botulinum]
MDIGMNIKKARKKAGVTQKELAEKVKKSERMIQKYENGEVIPSIEIIGKISDVLNVDFYSIVNDPDYEFDNPKYSNTEHDHRLTNAIKSADEKIGVKKWIKNTNIKEILYEVLKNNLEFEDLRKNIDFLGGLLEDEFKSVNNIPSEEYNLMAHAIKSKYTINHFENLIYRLILTIDLDKERVIKQIIELNNKK